MDIIDIRSDRIDKILTGIVFGIPTGTLITYGMLGITIPDKPSAAGIFKYLFVSFMFLLLWLGTLNVLVSIKLNQERKDKKYEDDMEKYIQEKISKGIEDYTKNKSSTPQESS